MYPFIRTMGWLLPLILVSVGLLYRMNLVDVSIGNAINCDNCAMWPVFTADALLLGIVAALLFLSTVFAARWLVRLLYFSALMVALIYLLDVFIYAHLGLRLFFSQVSVYAIEWRAIWEQFSAFAGSSVVAVTAAFILLFLLLIVPMVLPTHRSKKINSWIFFVLTVCFFSIYAFSTEPKYIHSWKFKNFLKANFESGETTVYSVDYLERAATVTSLPVQCIQGQGRRPNVILLLVESWSNNHSALFSGINDWTPNLDKLARENQWFSHFYANGFTTNQGLISSLTPIQLYAPFVNIFNAQDSFSGLYDLTQTIPRLFNDFGYVSAFLTTGPLSFVGKDKWIESLGFDEVEGNTHPFYNSWKKVAFQAAADEALFLRAMQWISAQDQPYFLTLENVSTHQPYVDPISGERSMEKVFRYTDRQIQRFYELLEQQSFFDNGVLIIASDHRSMTPITAAEEELYGFEANSKVPMLIIDKNLPAVGERDMLLQQSDFYFSFNHMLANDQVCGQANAVSLYSTDKTDNKCAFHLRGTQKGVIDVMCAKGQGQVSLQGDESQFIWQQGLSNTQQQQLLRFIAHLREPLMPDTH